MTFPTACLGFEGILLEAVEVGVCRSGPGRRNRKQRLVDNGCGGGGCGRRETWGEKQELVEFM